MSEANKKNENRESDRRDNFDRRDLYNAKTFPFKTKDGVLILKDRRKTPDRRVNNITVYDEEIDEQAFLDNYKKFF